MNPTSKKLISLVLVFSLMAISCASFRTTGGKREKHGAKLIVTKLDGQLIKGELIAVKPNSLLLLDTEGKDVSVGIAEIKVIRIVKKSKAGKGALYGLLIGGVIGVAAGSIGGKDDYMFSSSALAAIGGLAFGLYGALLGAGIGAVVGTDKKIQIEGKSDLEINDVLEKLRKKARIRDYK